VLHYDTYEYVIQTSRDERMERLKQHRGEKGKRLDKKSQSSWIHRIDS